MKMNVQRPGHQATSVMGQGKGGAAWCEGILENSKTRLKQKKVQHWRRVNCDGGGGVQAEELGCLARGWGHG